MDRTGLKDELFALARAAGDEIMRVYDTDFDVERKADASPLTEADLTSHRVIVRGLATLTPGLPVLSEESSEIDYEERRSWARYWLVDPLDGTKEFVNRNGEFTVNIALIEAHRAVLGVVHAPARGLAYFGDVEHGAVRRRDSAKETPIRVGDRCQTPARVVGSRSHAGPLLARFLARIGQHEIVPMGSSLKFCVVAEGGADIYPRLGPTSEWDTAAAQAVAEAAGAAVVDLDGAALRYNRGPDLLNPHFLVIGDRHRDWLSYVPRAERG